MQNFEGEIRTIYWKPNLGRFADEGWRLRGKDPPDERDNSVSESQLIGGHLCILLVGIYIFYCPSFLFKTVIVVSGTWPGFVLWRTWRQASCSGPSLESRHTCHGPGCAALRRQSTSVDRPTPPTLKPVPKNNPSSSQSVLTKECPGILNPPPHYHHHHPPEAVDVSFFGAARKVPEFSAGKVPTNPDFFDALPDSMECRNCCQLCIYWLFDGLTIWPKHISNLVQILKEMPQLLCLLHLRLFVGLFFPRNFILFTQWHPCGSHIKAKQNLKRCLSISNLPSKPVWHIFLGQQLGYFAVFHRFDQYLVLTELTAAVTHPLQGSRVDTVRQLSPHNTTWCPRTFQ